MSDSQQTSSKARAKDQPISFLDEDWSWSDPSSWPLSIKFLPVAVAIVGIGITVYFPSMSNQTRLNTLFADNSCTGTFNYTFQIARAKAHAEELSTHDWEIGTAFEAILELISPEKSVFGSNPFPKGEIPIRYYKMDEALSYFHDTVPISEGKMLAENGYSVSDPASLGVGSIMLGQTSPKRLAAVERQKDYLLDGAPRYANGAISHRVEVAELWSDAVSMVPPFLAYYGVAKKNLTLMREAARQCELYREVLTIREGERKGLWKHIVGPSEMADGGAWSTGNAWAAYGMLRVRATIATWSTSRDEMQDEIAALDSYILEITEGAMRSDDDDSGLLRNYLGDSSWFGETAGTALLAAAAYRMGMTLDRSTAERDKILKWADSKRKAVVRHVDADGVAKPVVNSLKHGQREPLDGINPEGESFLLMMGAAWRECVCSGRCSPDP
ncbi:hypothetical protein LTR37_017118 [Vermiconidia calcicola]|uniref:Uncharacterized protein n=1 Tax=Vermiconidia calcicola TaxID=1690605 RepID=A0ACC3MNP8_9PEZI|nr:hypothetical protein LTR37_017118 [Vermiconidia calcicola]